MSKEKKKFLLKDDLFNKEKVTMLAKRIHSIYRPFNTKQFIVDCVKGFKTRELKERISWIRICLHKHIPLDYRKQVGVLLKSLPAPLDPNKTDNDFGDFIYASYNDFVAVYGLDKKYLNFSLHAICRLTKNFSCEDAIRYFLNTHQKETMQCIHTWLKDKNYHVRRLCSEGTRPNLPWSIKVGIPVTSTEKILDALYCDSTRYVVRSVANHLNDISKRKKEFVIKKLKQWKSKPSADFDYLAKHALRTLIKNGDKDALRLIGIHGNNPIGNVSLTVHPKKIKIGEHLSFTVKGTSKVRNQLLCNYDIVYQNKKGQMQSKKTYTMKISQLEKNGSFTVQKKILFIKRTTRTLYRGKHKIIIRINGKEYASDTFILT
ncbi:MAG: DNA alkylation repair protein [Alphaproteobacteria bacterium]|nr:DNA alkylation repair protein [Alphaproteobacteria bacterium]